MTPQNGYICQQGLHPALLFQTIFVHFFVELFSKTAATRILYALALNVVKSFAHILKYI